MFVCQNDGEKDGDAASLSVDLGFPEEDDDQHHGDVDLIITAAVSLTPLTVHGRGRRVVD